MQVVVKTTADNELKHKIPRFVQIIGLHLEEGRRGAMKRKEKTKRRGERFSGSTMDSSQEKDRPDQLRLDWNLLTFPGLCDRALS